MTYETILFEKNGRVATITFNRPEVMNAMDLTFMKEMGDCLADLAKDDEVKVVVLKGAGRGFSSGGDIKAMVEGSMDLANAMDLVSNYIRILYTLPKITIAQIHGAAAGLGLSTALACDIVIAEETAKIAMNFIGIGLIPDGGGHFFMAERLGAVKAKQAIWKGEVMPGTKAKNLGLVDELVSEGTAAEAVEQRVQALLKTPLLAMIETKSIINSSRVRDLEHSLQRETIGQPKMRVTQDHLEGIQAFVEKRKPNFKGQ